MDFNKTYSTKRSRVSPRSDNDFFEEDQDLGGDISTDSNVTVEAKPAESTESLLRRFNREVQNAGILDKLRELEFYEKPSARKKREKAEREKRIKEYERWGN